MKTSFSLSEKQFLIFFQSILYITAKDLKKIPFSLNFDNKNAIKRVTPCKFLCQIIFCNVEFDQNCRKIEFHGKKKSSFKGKNRVLGFLAKSRFPRNAQKKPDSIGFPSDKENVYSALRANSCCRLFILALLFLPLCE